MKYRGFTLIELLSVIGIITLLTAISLPVFFHVRANSQKSTCASNIRQTWLSIRMYVDDNNGCWPTMNAWQFWGDTHPGLPICPNLKGREEAKQYTGVGYEWVERFTGYAYNIRLVEQPKEFAKSSGIPEGPTKDAYILYPANTVAVCEQAPNIFVSNAPDPFELVAPYPVGQEEGWKRHNGGANYAFCDGHVRWYPPEGVLSVENPPGNDGKTPTFSVDPPRQNGN